MSDKTDGQALLPDEPLVIIDFQEYLRKRKIVRRKNTMISYGKSISYEHVIEDLPTNAEFGISNWIKIRSRLTGKDEIGIADLASMERLDPETKKTVRAYTDAQVMVKTIVGLIIDWSFTDENGQKAEINEENYESLDKTDFDHVAAWFNKMINPPAKEAGTEDQPTANLSEDQKKD